MCIVLQTDLTADRVRSKCPSFSFSISKVWLVCEETLSSSWASVETGPLRCPFDASTCFRSLSNKFESLCERWCGCKGCNGWSYGTVAILRHNPLYLSDRGFGYRVIGKVGEDDVNNRPISKLIDGCGYAVDHAYHVQSRDNKLDLPRHRHNLELSVETKLFGQIYQVCCWY